MSQPVVRVLPQYVQQIVISELLVVITEIDEFPRSALHFEFRHHFLRPLPILDPKDHCSATAVDELDMVNDEVRTRILTVQERIEVETYDLL